ncbi:MAG: hypothetical protein JW768_03575 [Chitinispirillaceae bacterium]|nr:hypothetical protein [Chitinispirillaceae bacterium]
MVNTVIRLFFCLLTAFMVSCQLMEPEIVVVNNIAPDVMVRDPSFGGIVWNTVLAYGQATPPRRCLSGGHRVHFKKIGMFEYCRDQARYGQIDSLCMCDSSWASSDTDIIDSTPLWFNYQTISSREAGCGDFIVFELTSSDMEQDFSVPGPYGH